MASKKNKCSVRVIGQKTLKKQKLTDEREKAFVKSFGIDLNNLNEVIINNNDLEVLQPLNIHSNKLFQN